MHRARIATLAIGAAAVTAAPHAAFAQGEPPKDPQGANDEPAAAGADPKFDDEYEQAVEKGDRGAHAPSRQEVEAQSAPPTRSDVDDPEEKKFTLSGYVETFYQWNFNHPSNGITNYRAYDNRHNTFTLSNAVLDSGFRAKQLLARLALQVGHTAASQYQQETNLPGSGDGAAETGGQLWRHLQRASVGWQPHESLLIEGGLFLTSYGVEGFAVKDNWNWSRSNAFARLPNYQTGFKTTVHLGNRFDLIGGVYNGWNSIVDNNDEKSFSIQAQYKLEEALTTSITYFGGVEREGGAEEGRAWRHGGQAYVQWETTDWLEVAGESDGGFEDNRFGFHWYAAVLAWIRVKTTEWMHVAVRGDRLWEDPSASAGGMSRAFVVPAKHVTSGTATLDVRPVKGLSARLEYRHDRAASDLFFRKEVEGEGSEAKPYVPNTVFQNTLLVGMTAWF